MRPLLKPFISECIFLHHKRILNSFMIIFCFTVSSLFTVNAQITDTINTDTSYVSFQDTSSTTNTSSSESILGEVSLLSSCDNTPQWTQIGSSDDIYKCNTSGKVGIGTAAPTKKLDVVSEGLDNGVRINSFSHLNSRYIDISSTSSNFIKSTNDLSISSLYGTILLQPATAGSNKHIYAQGNLFVTNGGRLGINTTGPQLPLHIVLPNNDTENGIRFHGTRNTTSGHAVRIEITAPNSPAASNKKNFQIINQNSSSSGGMNRLVFRSVTDAGAVASDNIISLNHDGKIGIGTALPNHKLTVIGTVAACEVIVENTWCDYVFDPEYDLKSLNEVEKFIKENKHLPGIPSEKTVIDKGLNLGDMQKMQMEKIEELTLYMIELNKKVVQLEVENKLLKDKLSK